VLRQTRELIDGDPDQRRYGKVIEVAARDRQNVGQHSTTSETLADGDDASEEPTPANQQKQRIGVMSSKT
jgi:hypothetical protein